MLCSHCGSQLFPGNDHCPQCGAATSPSLPLAPRDGAPASAALEPPALVPRQRQPVAAARRLFARPAGYPNLGSWLITGMLRDWRGITGSLLVTVFNLPLAFVFAFFGTISGGLTGMFGGAFLGTLPGNILYGYGFCGNGISATHTGGKVLRDLVLGKDSDFTRLLYVDGPGRSQPSFPPEPLLAAGVRGVTRLMEWREGRS